MTIRSSTLSCEHLGTARVHMVRPILLNPCFFTVSLKITYGIHSRMKCDDETAYLRWGLASDRKAVNVSFLVLQFYHVEPEEIVAIGTGTKPRLSSFTCIF